jgi:hypothetical protein
MSARVMCTKRGSDHMALRHNEHLRKQSRRTLDIGHDVTHAGLEGVRSTVRPGAISSTK